MSARVTRRVEGAGDRRTIAGAFESPVPAALAVGGIQRVERASIPGASPCRGCNHGGGRAS